MSSRLPKSQAGCPHGQLLRQKAQRFKFIVEAVQLPAENFFVVLLLLLQRGNFVDPPLHDAGASAAALDEIVGLLLIQRDLFFDRGIKFLRHFVALLRVVNDVKAVDAERIVILVHIAELLNERFKRVHFVHVLTRDKIQMPGRADLGGLQHPQIAQADRLDLSAVRADLITLEQFLRPAAIVQGINVGVEANIVIPKSIVAPIVKNICQLFILIRQNNGRTSWIIILSQSVNISATATRKNRVAVKKRGNPNESRMYLRQGR